MSTIPYELVRSDRKSLALVIDTDAKLIARAPLKMPVEEIEAFINKKKHWIADKQKQVEVFGEKHPPVSVRTGESLMYLGNSYAIIKDNVDGIQVNATDILVPENYTTDDLIVWLKGEAEKLITERVQHYINIMGVKPNGIKLSEAKARWGSCSPKNSLNFAWRLVMCPLSVVDYVVVHELSHITYKNHSPAFWARVKTVLPAYEDEQEWLKLNRKIMEII